jgi:thiamine-phosphate pyrophosphorylase
VAAASCRQPPVLRLQALSLLYAILDLGYVAPENAEPVTRALLAGGADFLQLRAKGRPTEEIERLARILLPLCREAGVPFIVNDHPAIAAAVGADGVHIGQDDGSLAAVREIVGAGMTVGRSTHSPEQARAALAEGFDYIGFGPLFPTPTKLGRPGIGLENIPAVQAEVGGKIPVFCIGGIKRENLPEVLAAGARNVVIVSDLLTAPDVAAAVRAVKSRLAGG